MLDVHGADDGDARVEQVVDVLPALFVFRAWRVRVCELVDESQRGVALDDRVGIHLFDGHAFVVDLLAWPDL